MADHDLIRKKTRNALQEIFVRDYVLRTIEEEFDAAGLTCAADFDPVVCVRQASLCKEEVV